MICGTVPFYSKLGRRRGETSRDLYALNRRRGRALEFGDLAHCSIGTRRHFLRDRHARSRLRPFKDGKVGNAWLPAFLVYRNFRMLSCYDPILLPYNHARNPGPVHYV